MKLFSVSKGNLQVLEDIEPDRLASAKGDFVWADLDKIDTPTESILKELYGVEGLADLRLPAILRHDKYDLIVLNYFSEMNKRVLQILLMDDRMITLHSGADPACEEVMASVNEMLMSGGLDHESVVWGIFTAVLAKDTAHLHSLEEVMRNTDAQLRKGIRNIVRIPKLASESVALRLALYETRGQIEEISLGITPLRGLESQKRFKELYNSIDTLSALADGFSESVDHYSEALLPSIWKQVSRAKSIAVGLSIMSLAMAGSALFYLFFPDGLFGVKALYIMLGIIALGALGMVAAQRGMKFKVS